MNRFHEVQESLSVFEQFCKQVGLKNSDIRCQVHDDSTPGGIRRIFSLQFYVNENLRADTNKPFMAFFRDLLDQVRESDLVRAEVKVVEDKLKMANHEIDQNRAEIARLKRFETFYNMQYELNHGKELIEEKK